MCIRLENRCRSAVDNFLHLNSCDFVSEMNYRVFPNDIDRVKILASFKIRCYREDNILISTVTRNRAAVVRVVGEFSHLNIGIF